MYKNKKIKKVKEFELKTYQIQSIFKSLNLKNYKIINLLKLKSTEKNTEIFQHPTIP